MDDIEEIPVETTAGHRPNSTVGERMLIGLAAMALLGGALIAIANLLGSLSEDVVAVTSPTRLPPGLRGHRPVGCRAPELIPTAR